MPPLILGLLAVVGIIGFGAFKTGKGFLDNLKVHISPSKNIRFPNLSTIEFPVAIKIVNPTPTAIKLDSLFVTISKKSGEDWVDIAHSRPDLINIPINAYATSEFNLKLQTSLMTAASSLRSSLQNWGSNEFKIDARIGVEGQSINKVEIMKI